MKDSIFEFIMGLAILILSIIVFVQYFGYDIQPNNFSIYSTVVGIGGLIMIKLNQILEKNDKEKNK